MWLNLDRPALYAIGFRALSIITGPVTVLVIASCFSLDMQGYFYTFNAIIAMQALLELGLGSALQQIVSHEWAHLRINASGRVEGDPIALGRLATVAHFALKWFSAAGVLAVLGFGVGGFLFFKAAAASNGIAWEAPWWILCLVAGGNITLLPGWSILEGCNQVKQVYGFRLVQGLITRVVLWSMMLSGQGLWALVLERAVTLVLTAGFFLFRYATFFKSLFQKKLAQHQFWKTEIWPLQWRFAVVWISGYLPSLFIPVLFAYQGPEAAGRLGMTWALASALFSVSHAIIITRVPRLAIFAAKKAFDDLDRLFRQSLKSCLILLFAGAVLFLAALQVMLLWELSLAQRFLSLLPTGLLLGATFLLQMRHALGAYLRAHKKEPFLGLSLVEAVLSLCILFPLGKAYGALGLGIGYCFIAAVIYIPAHIIYRRCKKRWHGKGSQS